MNTVPVEQIGAPEYPSAHIVHAFLSLKSQEEHCALQAENANIIDKITNSISYKITYLWHM